MEQKYELEDLIKIRDGDYIIEIESTMALRPDDIVSAAFQKMDEMLADVDNQLKDLNIAAK